MSDWKKWTGGEKPVTRGTYGRVRFQGEVESRIMDISRFFWCPDASLRHPYAISEYQIMPRCDEIESLLTASVPPTVGELSAALELLPADAKLHVEYGEFLHAFLEPAAPTLARECEVCIDGAWTPAVTFGVRDPDGDIIVLTQSHGCWGIADEDFREAPIPLSTEAP